MGILDGIFAKKKKDIKIKESDSITDIASKLAKKGIISAPKDDNHNTFGEPLDKLIDGELPWGWVSHKKDFIEPRDQKLFDLSIKAGNEKNIDKEIKLLKEFIDFYYEYKKECIIKGECYEKYFSDMHMHCHNSQNDDFEFVEPKIERLKYLQDNYDEIIKKENLKKNIDSQVLELIKSNPGILQTDLYKKFDALIKEDISTFIYFATKNRLIRREKSGRTYKLYSNKK